MCAVWMLYWFYIMVIQKKSRISLYPLKPKCSTFYSLLNRKFFSWIRLLYFLRRFFFSYSFQITISYVYEAWFQFIFSGISFLFSYKNNTQYILIWIFTKKIYPILHILKTSQYILLFLIPLGFFYFLIRFFFCLSFCTITHLLSHS